MKNLTTLLLLIALTGCMKAEATPMAQQTSFLPVIYIHPEAFVSIHRDEESYASGQERDLYQVPLGKWLVLKEVHLGVASFLDWEVAELEPGGLRTVLLGEGSLADGEWKSDLGIAFKPLSQVVFKNTHPSSSRDISFDMMGYLVDA